MYDVGYYQLALYALWFFVYSFAGWAFEVVYTYGVDRTWVNRGFLYGPICPIYGVGALMAIILLAPIANPLVQFVAGAAGATVMEYATSWTLERIFHARWWDYSNLPLNLNGRVSVLSSALFGVMMVVVNFVVQPFLAGLVEPVRPAVMDAVALVLMALFVADLTSSVVHMNGLNDRLALVQRQVAALGASARERAGDAYQQALRTAELARDQLGETVSTMGDRARETAASVRAAGASAADGLRLRLDEQSRSELADRLAELLPGRPSLFDRKLLRDTQFRVTGSGEAFEWLRAYLRGIRREK